MSNTLTQLKLTYPTYRIWVTGHSLGGSLSSMAAFYIVNKAIYPSSKIKFVTFGEPRTGNYVFAKALEQSISFRYRIINTNDNVYIKYFNIR